jgi:hypothetical protein
MIYPLGARRSDEENCTGAAFRLADCGYLLTFAAMGNNGYDFGVKQ